MVIVIFAIWKFINQKLTTFIYYLKRISIIGFNRPICVCLFSLFNWFYPHKNWPIETEGTYSFEIIYKGSEFLVDEFPNSKDYYDQTEEKLEKI